MTLQVDSYFRLYISTIEVFHPNLLFIFILKTIVPLNFQFWSLKTNSIWPIFRSIEIENAFRFLFSTKLLIHKISNCIFCAVRQNINKSYQSISIDIQLFPQSNSNLTNIYDYFQYLIRYENTCPIKYVCRSLQGTDISFHKWYIIQPI